MSFRLRPKRISMMMAVYLLISFSIFAFGIIFWGYHIADQALKKEMAILLDYRHILVDDLFENQAMRIGDSLVRFKNQHVTEGDICEKSSVRLEESSQRLSRQLGRFKLDLLVIVRPDKSLCLDASSKLFPFENILPIIIHSDLDSSHGALRTYRYEGESLSLLLHSVPLIAGGKGKLVGYIIGGQVLNHNLSFMDYIRQKTKAVGVTFFESGQLIGSTIPLTSELIDITLKKHEKFHQDSIYFEVSSGRTKDAKGLLYSFQALKRSGESSDFTVGLLIEESSVSDLQTAFQKSGVYVLVFVVFFTALAIVSLQQVTALPLKNLLDYSEKVMSGEAEVHYKTGLVVEFNMLGRVMEKMVNKLKEGNERLQVEVSERKQVEEAVRKINIELDDRVNQRTAELEDVNQQLELKIEAYKLSQIELLKLSKAINQSASTIIITDTKGVIEFVNPFFTETTGYSAKEAIGRNANFLLADIYSDEFFKDTAEWVFQGKTWQGELVNKNKEGDIFWELATVSPIKSPEGEIINFVVIKDNITERKELEEELRAAKERAESSTRAKSAFLANMSHEIRTPMNSVVGFIDLTLETGSLSKTQRDHLDTARNSARNLLALINDILDISKMEAGKLEIESHPFNLIHMVQETLETLRFSANSKNLNLSLSLPPDMSQCRLGDSYRLRQILTNLIGNAIKFTERGTVEVSLECLEGEQIQFSVKDTGIGMSQQALEELFLPFTQADQSMARRYGGTGLGTTISQQLVELMGGKIWVESELEKGSAFFFKIPLEIPQCQEDCQLDCKEHGEATKSGFSGSRKGFKILMAEDIKENAELATIRLTQQGHQMQHVENGVEAVELYRREPFDLVLMDIHMPEMDGFQATREIRKLEQESGRRVPIIALTASIMTDERQQCLDAGMDMVVGKPVQFDELFAAIEQVVPETVGQLFTGGTKEIIDGSDTSLPTDLVGVDMQKGINTWQDKRKYAKALKAFAETYQQADRELEALIKAGDVKSAYQLSHVLKGVAGNLSITGVERVSIEIDSFLARREPESVFPLIDDLSQALKTAVSSIESIGFFEDESGGKNVTLDRERLENHLDQFSQLVKRGDFEEVVSDELLTILKDHIEDDIWRKLNAAVETFNFDEMEHSIKIIREVLHLQGA